MAREKVEVETESLDALDQVCITLNLEDSQCNLIREAAQEICPRKVKGKRAPSQRNIFIGECVKKKTGPITERFKTCVVEYKAQKEEK